MSDEASIHERQRAAIVARVPSWYSPLIHITVPTLLGLTALVTSCLFLRDVRAIELLAVPITLFVAFAFEWRVHKWVLHHRMPGVQTLYERHELEHHVVFTYDDMELRSWRELQLILMPAYAVVIVFLLDVPIALAVSHFVSRNAGLLSLATAMTFFVVYEWLHCAYHLPKSNPLGGSPLIARLRELHRRHHDPRLMKNWNFNVTVPVFDWIYGTVWSPEREAAFQKRRERRAKAAAQT